MNLTQNQIILIIIGTILLAVIYLNLNKKENLDLSNNKIDCESNICVDRTDSNDIKIHRLFLIENDINFNSSKYNSIDIYKNTSTLDKEFIYIYDIFNEINQKKTISKYNFRILQLPEYRQKFKNNYDNLLTNIENKISEENKINNTNFSVNEFFKSPEGKNKIEELILQINPNYNVSTIINKENFVDTFTKQFDNHINMVREGKVKLYDDSLDKLYKKITYSENLNINPYFKFKNETEMTQEQKIEDRKNRKQEIKKEIKEKYNLDIDINNFVSLQTTKKV